MTGSPNSAKRKGLDAVANSRGIIAALAIDQRSAMRTLFARAMDVEPAAVSADNLVQFKEAVSSVLTPYASAILLDPEYGLSAAGKRSPNAGLLLAYEESGYDKHVPGRMPRLLGRWSAQRLIEAGANAIKLLLYYSSRSASEVNDRKYAFVERVGAECANSGIPFFLELVSYADGMDDKGIEFARVKSEVVAAGMKEFSKPRYSVDVLKVGMPVNLAFVEGSPAASGGVLYNRAEAMQCFQQVAESATVPFIYLSEAVSNATFLFGLQLAAESGARFSGVLCGRATWQDGVEIFVRHGTSALCDWLSDQGVRNIENVNQCLAKAIPWFEIGTASSRY
jgi:tagatose 1,6-diphosphate aldolase